MNITAYADRVIQGGAIAFEEARALLDVSSSSEIDALCACARRVLGAHHDMCADVCSLVNARSGKCSEDCAFCAQSGHYQTGVQEHTLMAVDAIVSRARAAAQHGVRRFCIVTSGGELSAQDFAQVCAAYRRIRQETHLALDGSLGLLRDEQIVVLKEVGVTRVNHNLETSERFFPHICSTHTFRDRYCTVLRLKQHGMEVCSGGIIGMGETKDDRVSLAFSLKALEVDSVPINILNPRPGTPFAACERLAVDDIIKTVAVFRLILPCAIIKIAGGREVNLGEHQVRALRAGANGIITGGYLTTQGSAFEQDKTMLRHAGFDVPS